MRLLFVCYKEYWTGKYISPVYSVFLAFVGITMVTIDSSALQEDIDCTFILQTTSASLSEFLRQQYSFAQFVEFRTKTNVRNL